MVMVQTNTFQNSNLNEWAESRKFYKERPGILDLILELKTLLKELGATNDLLEIEAAPEEALIKVFDFLKQKQKDRAKISLKKLDKANAITSDLSAQLIKEYLFPQAPEEQEIIKKPSKFKRFITFFIWVPIIFLSAFFDSVDGIVAVLGLTPLNPTVFLILSLTLIIIRLFAYSAFELTEYFERSGMSSLGSADDSLLSMNENMLAALNRFNDLAYDSKEIKLILAFNALKGKSNLNPVNQMATLKNNPAPASISASGNKRSVKDHIRMLLTFCFTFIVALVDALTVYFLADSLINGFLWSSILGGAASFACCLTLSMLGALGMFRYSWVITYDSISKLLEKCFRTKSEKLSAFESTQGQINAKLDNLKAATQAWHPRSKLSTDFISTTHMRQNPHVDSAYNMNRSLFSRSFFSERALDWNTTRSSLSESVRDFSSN